MKCSVLLLTLATTLVLLSFTGQASAYYNPTVGRWAQRDPIEYREQANTYAYCGGRPINGVDPSGLQMVGPTMVYGRRGSASVTLSPAELTDGYERSFPRQSVAAPGKEQALNWSQSPPLKSRCTGQSGSPCTERTMTFYHSEVVTPGPSGPVNFAEPFATTGKGVGSTFKVEGIAHLLATLDANLGSCQCVQKLTIDAHGGYDGDGGFQMQAAHTEDDANTGFVSYVSEADRGRRYDVARENVTAFAKAIKDVMCPGKCMINIMSCGGGQGQTAAKLASLTQCAVRATMGKIGWAGEGGRSWWARGAVREFMPDGTSRQIIEAGTVGNYAW